MTVQESADALRVDRGLVALADYDDRTGEAYCPCCGGPLTADRIATPTLDADAFPAVDIALPVYGWRCRCRRTDLSIVAPIAAAPGSYVGVDATIGGAVVEIGVPAPAFEGVPDDA